MPRLLLTFLVCEIAYVASARVLARHYDGGLFHLELWWTLLRLISASALVFLFLRLDRTDPARKPETIPARCLIATAMFLAPILVGNMGFKGPEQWLFAVTSLVVGLREELAYRGILQRLLTRRFGLAASLIVSNLAFILYHWGVQPFALHYVVQIFLCGTILGLVYHLSGRIVLVVALHAVYDAIDSFTPYLAPPLPGYVCTVVLTLTLGALLLSQKASTKTSKR